MTLSELLSKAEYHALLTHEEYKELKKQIQSSEDCISREEALKEAYINGYDYGVKDWFKAKTEPCEDSVSRADVISLVNKGYLVSNSNYKSVCDAINALPSVTPQPKVGKWIDDVIENEDTNLPIQACSICKTFYPLSYTGGGHNYCPNCGAKMQEVEE